MTQTNTELLDRLVVGRSVDGRSRYDAQAKLQLVQACLKPGVSVANMALRYGINANLLRKWMTKAAGLFTQSLFDEVTFSTPMFVRTLL